MSDIASLYLDPGLDCTGFAVYIRSDSGPTPEDFGACLRRELRTAGEIVTGAGEPLASRLRDLALDVAELVRVHDIVDVVVEQPAKPGAYKRNQGKTLAMAGGMAKLNAALGAIVGALALEGITVRLVSDATPKAKRWQLLEAAERSCGVQLLPRGARGALKKDAADAVWLGVAWR